MRADLLLILLNIENLLVHARRKLRELLDFMAVFFRNITEQ